MLLLTWHGTIVALPGEGAGIVHLALPRPVDGPAPLDVDTATPGQATMHPALGPITVRTAPHGVSVARYGRFLSADRNTAEMVFDRTSVGEWESFLPISPDGLALLQHILGSRWIERDTRAVVARGDVGLRPGFVLALAGAAVDLRAGLEATVLPGDVAPGPAPDRLQLADGRALVVAGPRSSPLIRTEIWPVRARRTAEMMALAAHRGLLGREPEQDAFDADVAGLMRDAGAAGLQDLLERMRPDPPAAAVPVDDAQATDDILRGWALREMTPWLMTTLDRAALQAAYEELNATRRWAALYRIEGADVQLLPKPDAVDFGEVMADRAQHYLNFLRAVATRLPDLPGFTLCLGVTDTLPQKFDLPVFTFQRAQGAASVQLPDIDFLVSGFYEDGSFTDPLATAEKAPVAVFAGSTTGGNLLTMEAVQTLSPPRLRAASHFVGHPRVDFRLPNIVQTATPEVRALLEAQPYCRTPHLVWAEQLKHRFIISMDGNGATCSRIALTLRSNSVLLKYNSPHLLYYFAALQPWVHYVPVANDRDIDVILAMADRDPALFERISSNGRAFAQRFLGREQAIRYTAMLLEAFAAHLTEPAGMAAPPVPKEPRPASTTVHNPCGTYVLAHVRDTGDVRSGSDGWAGEPGSLLWIEGFAIHFGRDLPGGITYAALQADGALSPAVTSGTYRGTRSVNAPVFGLRIDVPAGCAFDVGYEARFVDGSWAGPVPAGTICRAESGAAMEAVRVIVQQRMPEITPAATG